MGQNSCQPEGLQPESALAALLVLAIERLLPSPGALPSPILAATHTCFIMLGALSMMRQRAADVIPARVREVIMKIRPRGAIYPAAVLLAIVMLFGGFAHA